MLFILSHLHPCLLTLSPPSLLSQQIYQLHQLAAGSSSIKDSNDMLPQIASLSAESWGVTASVATDSLTESWGQGAPLLLLPQTASLRAGSGGATASVASDGLTESWVRGRHCLLPETASLRAGSGGATASVA